MGISPGDEWGRMGMNGAPPGGVPSSPPYNRKRMTTKTTNNLRRQAGQLLIMGFDGQATSNELKSNLATLQPGGVILFARNIAEPKQTWKLLRSCQAAVRTPMFLCVDMEGGTVDRLKNVIAPAPAVQDVFTTGNLKLFRMHGHIMGLEVRALGFTT